MEYRFYSTFFSPFDMFTIVWKETGSSLQLQRIYLSDPELKSDKKAFNSFKHINLESSLSIETLGEKIQQFLTGAKVDFSLELIDFNRCSEVQKKVLKAEYEIPRGWVSTYKRIADKIGLPKGARAVGNALARNPFPIIIPCHRAIKSNGDLGGFQGGIKMKRALLELEGIEFSERGMVVTKRIYY